MSVPIAQTTAEIRAHRAATSGRVALVPTMGALHAGHISLVERGHAFADQVWVSIFVNPTQFGPNEDFDRYPRDLETDLAMCEAAGVDLVFAPRVEDIYPHGVSPVAINVPDLAGDLEGARRPVHFGGVCRVVAKLLNLCQPDVACFGQKDYQQLAIVRAMVRDLAMPVVIEPVPTLREPDGLAMSSRNRYLSANERPHATALFHALNEARQQFRNGVQNPDRLEATMADVLASHGLQTDYAVVRDGTTLAPIEQVSDTDVALIAARLGHIRLIDNMLMGPEPETT